MWGLATSWVSASVHVIELGDATPMLSGRNPKPLVLAHCAHARPRA
jgi:hypothetical protein